MAGSIFAERFTVDPPEDAAASAQAGMYEEACGYSVTSDGAPLVEAFRADNTTTMTFVEAESVDSDRAWDEAFASIDEETRVRRDMDVWDIL